MTVRYYGLEGNGPWEVMGSPREIHPFPEDHVNSSVLQIERIYAVKPFAWMLQGIGQQDEFYNGAFLALEEQVRRTAAFIYFRRLYSEIPEDHVEYTTGNYKFPDYRETFFDVDDNLLRTGPTKTVPVRVSYSYELTEDPENEFTLESAFQPMAGAYERDYVGDDTTPDLDAYKLLVSQKEWIRAEDDVFERWSGNIWRRVRKEVLAQ